MEEPLRLNVGGRVRTFSRPYVLIGRHPGADVVVSRHETQRLQAYLQVIGGRLLAIDISGAGGIRWGDGTQSVAGWLDPGRTLRVGPVRVSPLGGMSSSARDPADDTPPPIEPPPLALVDSSSPALVEVTPPPSGDGTAYPACQPVGPMLTLIGRSRRCGVQLPGWGVSDFHAALVQTSEGLWLVDLLGRGGVAVNGVFVTTARLADGDSLEIGGYAIRVRLDERANASPAGLPAPASLALPALNQPANLPAENVTLGSGALVSAFMHLSDQLGESQQRMLEQFLDSVATRFREESAAHRENQAELQHEVHQLRKLVEVLVRDRRQDPGGNASRPDDAAARPPADPQAFYAWLANRTEAIPREPRGRLRTLFGRLLGHTRGTGHEY